MTVNVIELLRTVYQSMPKETLPEKGDGWVNLVNFAPAIKNAGVDYKAMGYEKFGDFVAESGIFYLWTDLSSSKPAKYITEKVKKQTFQRKQPQHTSFATVDSQEVVKIKRRLRLENNQFIGQFAPQLVEGWYKITDIRNTDFTKIEDKERGVKNLFICFKSLNKEFKKFAYYKFTWVLLESSPLKFGIDLREEVTPVFPKDIVSCLHDGIMRYPAGAAKLPFVWFGHDTDVLSAGTRFVLRLFGLFRHKLQAIRHLHKDACCRQITHAHCLQSISAS